MTSLSPLVGVQFAEQVVALHVVQRLPAGAGLARRQSARSMDAIASATASTRVRQIVRGSWFQSSGFGNACSAAIISPRPSTLSMYLHAPGGGDALVQRRSAGAPAGGAAASGITVRMAKPGGNPTTGLIAPGLNPSSAPRSSGRREESSPGPATPRGRPRDRWRTTWPVPRSPRRWRAGRRPLRLVG